MHACEIYEYMISKEVSQVRFSDLINKGNEYNYLSFLQNYIFIIILPILQSMKFIYE